MSSNCCFKAKHVDNDTQNVELSYVDDVLETNINVNSFKRRKRSVLTNSEKLNLTVDESQEDLNVNDEAHFNPRSSSCSSAEENQNSNLFIDIERTDHDDRDSMMMMMMIMIFLKTYLTIIAMMVKVVIVIQIVGVIIVLLIRQWKKKIAS